jgi:PAS domain-containing protein
LYASSGLPERRRMNRGDERTLRGRALRELAPPTSPSATTAAADSDVARHNARIERMLQELQVNEVELAMQNEELRAARDDEAVALRCYIDLFDHAPVGYLMLDRHGVIEQINLLGADLLGGSPQALAGKRLALFVAEHCRIGLHEALSATALHPGVTVCEVDLLAGKGCTAQVEAHAEPGSSSLLVALLDISTRKRAEAAEREVRRLQDSIRLQAEAMSSFGDALRAPLNAIKSCADLLLACAEPAPADGQRQWLHRILDAGQRLQELVDASASGPPIAKG